MGSREGVAMTLLEAFRWVAPLVGDPGADRQRTEAARTLHRVLMDLAVSTPLLRRTARHDRDEAVATVLLRLVQAGPRAAREGDPQDDLSVTRYLRAALHNAARDMLRSASRRLELPWDDRDQEPESSRSADDLIDISRAARELDVAFEDLRTHLLPLATGGRRGAAGTRLQTAVQQLIELFEGRTSIERLVAQMAPDCSPEQSRKARYALYQRHHRAIVSLLEAFHAVEQQAGLPGPRLQALRVVLNGLRIGSEPRTSKEDS